MAKKTATRPRAKEAAEQLSFDKQLLNVYVTGLQAEVEAKLRRVTRFREQMQKIDATGGRSNLPDRRKAADALLAQIAEMLEANLSVRETLEELRSAAEAVRRDIDAMSD